MRYVLLISLLMFSQLLSAAEITAQVDRNTLHLNESFQLVLEASGSIDDDPDFSVLEKDFDILSRSQASNISIINGNYRKTIKWSLTLMPRQAGVITLPSVPFGKDHSPQLQVTVKPASAPGTGQGDDLYLEVEASGKQAYVQGQLLITVKMLSGNNISQYGINELQHEGVEVVVEQLGEDKQYRAYRGSKPYLVLERNYALFPQQPGSLRILPFRGEVEVGGANRGLFDPFGGRSQIKRVRSRGLDIEVRGMPQAFTGPHWLPAQEIQLVEEWPDARDGKPVFNVGEPVTRSLSLLADGLTSAQLPQLATAGNIDGIKQYPDQPTLHDNKKPSGIIGIREERIALIPTRAGSYTLPAIEIPWWNVNTGQMEIARIAARQIQVAAGSATTNPRTAVPQAGPAPAPSADDTVPQAPPAASDSPAAAPWKRVSLLLGSAWLLTLAGWWWSRRQRPPSRPAASEADRPRRARTLKQLQRTCQENDAAGCQRALIDWGREYYADPSLSSLGQLGKRAGEPLQSAISSLELALYGKRSGDWTGADIARICQQMGRPRPTGSSLSSGGLEPLYK